MLPFGSMMIYEPFCLAFKFITLLDVVETFKQNDRKSFIIQLQQNNKTVKKI